MDPSGFIFLFFMAFLLIIFLGVVNYRKQLTRMRVARRFARRWGLRYTRRDLSWITRYEPGFKTLRKGTNRYVFNLMRGEYEGRPLAVFDHHYEVKSKNSSSSYRRTMVLVRLDVDLGEIEMRPEGWGDRIAGAFGFDDIDFESAEFSRRYYVQASEKTLAYQVFHPKMIEFLLGLRDIRLATYGRHILTWRKRSSQLSMLETRDLIEDTYGILDRIPRYLEKDRSAP